MLRSVVIGIAVLVGSAQAQDASESSGDPNPIDEPGAPEAPLVSRDPIAVELVAPEWPADRDGDAPFEVFAFVHVEPDGHATAVFFADDLPPAFRAAAREALLSSRFEPGLRDGVPVPADVRVSVVFTPPERTDRPRLPDGPYEVIVIQSDPGHPTPDRGAGDERIRVADVQAVQTTNPSDALKLAPSVFITQTGNSVHPEQVFLRGFDARHGQDLAFSVDGVPLNQIGNPHGHGLVDFHVIPVEALRGIRVLEGPFDPAQGDFAVAGSVEAELGLDEPGLLLRLQGGSFGTGRAVVGWQHPDQHGSFVVAEVMRTAGYGENRAAQSGGVLARVEGGVGARWFAVAGAYASAYDFAGVVRQVDVDAGRVDLYGTPDRAQGGSFEQAFVGTGASGRAGDAAWRVRVNGALRHQRLRTNFTGFLTDDRRAGESQHDQRGDLTDQASGGGTFAMDGEVRQALRNLPGGTRAELAIGATGRFDDIDGRTWRVAALDLAPYRVEADYRLRQADLGLYAEGELSVGALTVRAGARVDALVFDLTDRCGARDTWFPGAPVDDVNCPAVNRNGPRLRADARTAQGLAVNPRASAIWRPRPEHALSAAVGRGFRSIEALALSADEDSPFGSLWAGEVGWAWRRAAERWTGEHRVSAFTTHVSRDLIFDEFEVRNVVAGETHRVGASAVSQVEIGPLVERTTVTYTYAVFGDELAPSVSRVSTDRKPGMLIPYVPPWVARTDWSVGGRVPSLGLDALRGGLAVDLISPRPLPQSERGSWVFTVDLQAVARVKAVELALAVTNVGNARYPLAEYNFASWFPASSGEAWPTRVASRQIAPGAPRAVLASITLRPGAG